MAGKRRQTRPRRKTGASIPELLVKKEPGRPAKERVSTNNPSLQGVFINKSRKEGGGAIVKVIDQDPTLTTTIVEPHSSKITQMNLTEEGNTIKIETENRYGKKETSYITEEPYNQLLEDIKKSDKYQNRTLAKKYTQHEIRSLADSLGVPINKSNEVTINNIRTKIKQERTSEILTTPQVKRYEYYTMAVHEATNPDQLTAIYKELVDDKDLPDIYKKEVRYKIEYKTNDLRERHLKYEFSYDKKILHAHTKEQLMDIREQFGNSSLSQTEKEQLDKKWQRKFRYLQDLESDHAGQNYLTEIKRAKSERDLEIVKKQIVNNKTFNPTEGQIETLNNAFKKKTQELIDNKKDEKELTQEMEDLLSSKERLDYKNLSGKQEEEFRKQFKPGLIPPYRRGAGATTYYKDGIEYYFYTEPATGTIKYDGARNQESNKMLELTIPEVQKALGWERINIEPMD